MRDDLRDLFLARGLAPKTAALYARTIEAAMGWSAQQGTTLRRLSPGLLAEYVETLPRTWSSRKLLRSALAHYWDATGRHNPPLAAIRVPPKPEMVCRAHEDDEARLLAKEARDRQDSKGLVVLLGLYQAMRREEIATLPWDAVAGGWLRVIGKGERERRLPIHQVVDEALARLRHPSAGRWVFPGRFGGPVHVATVWAWTLEVAAAAGVEGVTPHRLRHTSLAIANDNTGDLRAVQAFAGHSRPETTAGYTRATTRRLRAVVDSIEF